jgi:hypothetical protein
MLREVAIDSFDLLNAMYAAVHLLMLVATVTGLWAAVNAVIATPNVAHVFHCIPPRASNLAYSSVVLELKILLSLKKQFTFSAVAFQTVDAKLDGRVQRAAILQSVLNGDWREPVLEHYCYGSQTGGPCCKNLEDTTDKIRLAVLNGIFISTPPVFALNKWSKVLVALAWFATGMLLPQHFPAGMGCCCSER